MALSIDPAESLEFRGPLDRNVASVLHVSNHNTGPVAFKVCTTAQKRYSVRPNFGKIDAEKSISISFIRQPDNALSTSLNRSDKFVILSKHISNEDDPGLSPFRHISPWSTNESETDGVHQKKFKAVHVLHDNASEATKSKSVLSIDPAGPSKQSDEASGVSKKSESGHSHRDSPVSLSPSKRLEFQRPFNRSVRRTITVTNNDTQPVAIKVKLNAPKNYTAKPSASKLDPKQSLDITGTQSANQVQFPASSWSPSDIKGDDRRPSSILPLQR
jgi:hypothetical protein